MESIVARIAELNAIILASFKDSSVESAGIWAKAVIERSELENQLNTLTK